MAYLTASTSTSRDGNDPGGTSEQQLLTIVEAANILRTPVATLRYWRSRGSGPCSFRLGRRVVYRSDDLATWISTQHDQGTPIRLASAARVSTQTYPKRS